MTEKEEVFNTDFSDMAQFDSSIDINEVFENSVNPGLKEPEVDDPEEDQPSAGPEEDDALDVNKVLADQQAAEDDKDEPEEDTDTEDTPVHNDTDDSPSSETPFTVVFAKDLYEQGLLSSYNEEEVLAAIEEKGEAGVLRDLFQAEVDQSKEAIKSDYDDTYQEYLNLVGKGVQKNVAATITDLKDNYSKITVESIEDDANEDLRRQIITDYYKMSTKMSDDRIKRFVDKSIDMGDDVDEAKEYLESINTLISDQITHQENQAVENRRTAEEENTRQLTVLKENIDSLSEILPGQRINKQTKNKMYEDIVKPVKDKNGNVTNSLWALRAEDPTFFDLRLAYLKENGFFVKGKPWDKIKNIKVTKEANQLEDYLSKKKNTGSRVGSFSTKHEEVTDDVREMIRRTGDIL